MARKKRYTARRTHRRIARKSFFRSKLFSFLGLTVLGLFLVGQYAKTHVSPQNVLSDSSSGGDHGGGGDSHDSGGGGSSGGGSSGGSSGSTQTQQAPQNQQNVQKTETETHVGNVELKTKVEDNGAVKVEGATQAGFQFKIENQNGQSELQVEDSRGNKLHEQDQTELENELENEGIDISTEDGKFAITKHDIKAVSELPLSVDKSKTQILITTPNGKTVPVILPDVAIDNLSRVGIMTGFASGSGQTTGTPSSSLTLSTNANGIPVYYVPAFKHKNFFGIVPVQVPVTTEVSAETGAVMGEQQAFSSQLLDALSF